MLSEIGNFRSEISDERFSMRFLSEMRVISEERLIGNRSSEILVLIFQTKIESAPKNTAVVSGF